ncbi:MAG: hypothetical protein ACI8XC_002575 [Gammaproteobacteria bacterium]|jgi:hypothetical protein
MVDIHELISSVLVLLDSKLVDDFLLSDAKFISMLW